MPLRATAARFSRSFSAPRTAVVAQVSLAVCFLASAGTALGQPGSPGQQGTGQAPDEPITDPVAVAGEFYEVVLENPRVRVLRATYPPGKRSAMHRHTLSVVIQMTGGSLRFTTPAGQVVDQRLPEGRVAMSAGEHAVENIGDEDIVVLIVELKEEPSLLRSLFGP